MTDPKPKPKHKNGGAAAAELDLVFEGMTTTARQLRILADDLTEKVAEAWRQVRKIPVADNDEEEIIRRFTKPEEKDE